MSDSNGYVYDPNGIDLAYVKDLKEVRRGRIKEYAETHEGVTYVADCTKVWTVPCDIALPCATQNEINKESAEALVKGGCTVVCEGANMPSTPGGHRGLPVQRHPVRTLQRLPTQAAWPPPVWR